MIKQYSQMFDLCGTMKGCASQHVRHLFMEGDHKYKDNLGKVEVHCFLLTDMLLVCKSIAKKGLGTLKVIRQPYLTDRLIVQHSNNLLSCVYLNEFQVAVSAFTLQCTEAKNWYEALKRAKMIYTRLKQSSSMTPWDAVRYGGSTADSLGIKKSPMNSSICSHVTSANNSHSGSVEWNDSRNISVEFEKTNSLSSDEGCTFLGKKSPHFAIISSIYECVCNSRCPWLSFERQTRDYNQPSKVKSQHYLLRQYADSAAAQSLGSEFAQPQSSSQPHVSFSCIQF